MESLCGSEIRFGLLLSIPQVPNCVMPFVAGIIIDVLGFRLGVFSFTFAVFIGQVIETIGGSNDILSYGVVMGGLFVYQFGVECGSTAISK